MDYLKRMEYFTEVVQCGSFSKAGIKLGKSKSVISKHLSSLEDEIGIKLLHRSTRQLSLTEAGHRFYHRSVSILEEAKDTFEELKEHQETPTGTLRVACPNLLGADDLIPLAAEFMLLYPEINIDFIMDDNINNTLTEGVDISIRAGWLKDSDLIGKKLHSSSMCLVASPAYLNRHGSTPTNIAELESCNGIDFSRLPTLMNWKLKKDDISYTPKLNTSATANSAIGVRAFVLAGQGVAMLSMFGVKKELKNKQLVQLLPDYEMEDFGIYALYPRQRFMPRKNRLFLDFLSERFEGFSSTNGG